MSDQSASGWRLQLARRIAAAYSPDPDVAAVEVGGSTARGTADRHSDVEIGVFWRAAPTVAARDAAYTRAGGTALQRYPWDADIAEDAEEFLVAGVKVDVSHRSLAAVRARINRRRPIHDQPPW